MARRKVTRKKWKKKVDHLSSIVISLLALYGFFTVMKMMIGDIPNSLASSSSNHVLVESSPSHEAFIEQLAPTAQQLQDEFGVLPSIILGQAILESDWGTSQLAASYYNLYGIKGYDDTSVMLETKEFVDGKWKTIQAPFKVYANWEESMRDHSLLFVNGVDWNPQLYHAVLQATNYRDAAFALQSAGYATDPNYQEKIVSVIENYQLAQYDSR
ncbi:glycoside hydrolase family 73 protein [Vagococcus lutrae]|uniref:glycoside hydrolase family 73 protein n=1 Tax=Vagococcus lutrae TaxID=81947 RepID=UPI00200FF6D4|nr:glycoside hydrolase family 73 protein [Vagococcus lutrae]MDT2805453.1 glycoside hydrolase family 73 protein [Vagococcus lutrae]MDT2816474.1 glycoside hydrolase family 73 protein [Vagococcus lutrae]MDT2823630.1 glycoside hydrolase family 73 protein [Vagococcus lutrae]MDY3706087.1 glycoside hydrolase family 73 protein [Vagococcus lutrae]UQF19493.1 glycoside hydrolase family 73 protein [Vagococcus lutrae]